MQGSSQDEELQSQWIISLSPSQNKKCRASPGFKCKVGVLLALVIIVALIAVPRTVVLGKLIYRPPLNVSLCEMNSTRLNSSNSTEIQTDCAEIPAESDNMYRSRYFQVTDLLYVIYSILSLPEYVALAYGLFMLLIKMPNYKTSTREDSKKFLEKLCKRCQCGKSECECLQVCLGTFLASIFIGIFTLASLAIPIVGIIHAHIDNRCYPDCKEQILNFRLAYHSLTFLAHMVIPIIRIAMVVTVLEVRAIWFYPGVYTETTKIKNKKKEREDKTDTKEIDEMKAITNHYKYVTEYMDRVKKIKRLLQVFQTWFVIQWFHYFFQAITDLTRTLHPWITGTTHPELIVAYHGVYTVYDILAFAIPHVCGLKINTYHQKYLKDKRKEQLKAAESKLEYVKAYSLRIEKSKYGDFVPEIRATGIKIPLDSTGYTLSILLTIFALAASFMSFSM